MEGVRACIAAGVSVNACHARRRGGRWCALKYAARWDHTALMTFLATVTGIDGNVRDENNETPLHIAAGE